MLHKSASIILATLLMLTPVAYSLAAGHYSGILLQPHSALATVGNHQPEESGRSPAAQRTNATGQSVTQKYRPGPLPLPLATLLMLSAITGMGAFIHKTAYRD